MTRHDFFFVDSSREVPGEKGCFTSRGWERGEILERITLDDALPNLMHVDNYIPISAGESAKYGYRYAGDLIHYSPERRIVTDFINHSRKPNVVIYMGYTIALRNIAPGEEILADYRFLMHSRFKMDCGVYSVEGMNAAEADREFVRVLHDLDVLQNRKKN
jgi:hypothetical protein